MRALVTGASGFIGSHLVAALLDRGVEVLALSRRASTKQRDGVVWVYADLADISCLKRELNKVPPCDYIFHFGAQMHAQAVDKNIRFYIPANVEATAFLIEQAVTWSTKSFVYASGTGIIGKPKSVPITEMHELSPSTAYHLTKYLGEELCQFACRTSMLSVASLRITSPYGPGMSNTTVIPRFLDLAQSSQPIELFGSGKRTQNFVHVQDVVRAALMSADARARGIFNIGGKRDISMKELAETVIRVVPNCRSVVLHANQEDPQDDFRWTVDIEKARRDFGYNPDYDLESGLKTMLCLSRSMR